MALLTFGDRYFFLVGIVGLCSEMLRGIPDLSFIEANNTTHLQIGQPKIPPAKSKCLLGLPLKPLIEGGAFQKSTLLDMAQEMELNSRIVWEVQPKSCICLFSSCPHEISKEIFALSILARTDHLTQRVSSKRENYSYRD